MMLRAMLVLMALVGLSALVNGAETAKKATTAAAPPVNERVVRLITTSAEARPAFGRFGGRGRFGGGNNGGNNNNNTGGGGTAPGAAGYVVVTPAEGGVPVKLMVADDVRRKLGSLGGQLGELVTITFNSGSAAGTEIVTAVVPFDGPKELKRPQAFIFDGMGQQKIGVQTFTAARLSKFGQTREAVVPNRIASEGGKAQPDAELVERLRGFAAGDVVEVELTPGPGRGTFTLVDIDAVREPQVGEFVKLTSVKDLFEKVTPAVVIEVNAQEVTYTLPAQAPGAAASPNAAAMAALAKRLKPGFAVRFVARPVEGKPAMLRALGVDGDVTPTSEKHLELVSTFVRVEMYEDDRTKSVNVDYRPGSGRGEDRYLERGVARAIESDAEIARLKLSPERAKQLSAVLDESSMRTERPAAQEQAQWVSGYRTWMASRDDAARLKIEQDLLWAGQELSLRGKKEMIGRYTLLRSLLTPEQLEEVIKLGQENGPMRRRP
jgi:hypothetical protein